MRKILVIISILAGLQAYSASKHTVLASEQNKVIDIIFNEVEKRIIEDFYRGDDASTYKNKKVKKHKNKKGLPPGLAKKKNLPPGLAKQLAKNGTLPPGLAKRNLPDDLLSRLPARDDKFKRIIIDNDVLLIERGTEIILDILEGVIAK